MQHLINAVSQASRRKPWNKGKLVDAKPPLRPKHVWSIRTKLQIAGPYLVWRRSEALCVPLAPQVRVRPVPPGFSGSTVLLLSSGAAP
jgi:hypothetical protein